MPTTPPNGAETVLTVEPPSQPHSRRTSFRQRNYSGCQFIFHASLVLLFLVLLAYGEFVAIPYEQAVFCNDTSIQLEYWGDTVPNWALLGVGFAATILIVVINEAFVTRRNAQAPDNERSVQLCRRYYGKFLKIEYQLNKIQILYFISVSSLTADCYLTLGASLLGFAIVMTISTILKVTFGKLRPNFWDVCQLTNADICQADPNGVIEHVKCADNNKQDLRQIRMSFPSG